MQFIRLPKAMDIAERVLPELVSDWMNTKILQIIDIRLIQSFRVNILISWVIKWSKSGMTHRRTFTKFTHRAWAIRDMSNHDLFQIIPNPGHQKQISLSVESISTMPCQVGTRYVKILECGHNISNREMPCLVRLFGTFRGTRHRTNENPAGLFWCPPDIFSIITNCEIQRPRMLIDPNIGQVSYVGCSNDCHNCCPSRKLILHFPHPIACVRRAVHSATFRVCKAHWFEIDVRLKWEMSPKELYTFENIAVV